MLYYQSMEALSKVETVLNAYCADKILKADAINPRYASLWQEIDQYLKNGGKRMRPRLVLMTYEAYGGEDLENIIPVAAERA